MSPCIRSNKGKNTRIITQISEDEYFIEGESDWIKFGCQFDPSFVTSANLDGGLYLLVNDSFLGKGKITHIHNIETDRENYFLLKITIKPYK
jgi:hypothetical protein